MTPLTALDLEFADGSYLFELKLPQLGELQEKRGCGIFKLYGRVLKGRYLMGDQPIAVPEEGEVYAEDMFETIRLGLIGGGRGMVGDKEIDVSPLLAKTLVERYCHPAPLRQSWAVAAAVLAARIEGYNPPKKDEPAKAPAAKRTTGSTSRKRSGTVPSSASTGGS